MRTLVVGAGATGGYFGGRMVEANCDVTFLVRPRRAQELAVSGLRIRSRFGDITIPKPATVIAENLKTSFDLVLLSCKAYDLDSAVASFAPAVGPETAILPLLNGMRHLDLLEARFTPRNVLGGVCVIAATLNAEREIAHLNDAHSILFGERDGSMSDRIAKIDKMMDGVRFNRTASPNIILDMWEKWVFLATLAGGTCLFRAAIGDIALAAGGTDFVLGLLDQCRSIAAASGFAPREAFLERSRGILTAAGSSFTASMLRDIEAGAPVEADHIIGDLLARGAAPLVKIVYAGLKAYEARRSRQAN